jgi:hypothetical protein
MLRETGEAELLRMGTFGWIILGALVLVKF